MARAYTKRPLTGGAQVALLQSRGLIIDDFEVATRFLENHSYYRFSAYTYVFEEGTTQERRSHQFIPGTKFSDITEIYHFDQKLREILFRVLSKLEVALRTRICLALTNHHESGFFYIETDHYKEGQRGLSDFLSLLNKTANDSHEVFITHYKRNYNLRQQGLPLWFAIEILSFGQISRFFESLSRANQKIVARDLNISQDNLLSSWIEFISYVRNLCAHHSRLWNRRLTKTPKKDSSLALLDHASIAQAIFVIAKLLSACDIPLKFLQELENLFAENPEMTPTRLGFSKMQFSEITQHL